MASGPAPRWWPEPTAGDIVWCRFPDGVGARPKPRTALVLAVFDDDAPRFRVRVAYGTSQRVDDLFSGEFAILRLREREAFTAAGLSYDTKFNLGKCVDLPYDTEWFDLPPRPRHGALPRLGTLHPSLVRAAQAAYAAVRSPRGGSRDR
jgi:hypothetical protein